MKRGLRTHEAAIPAAELVAWLHKALQGNVNFGADVTREQTVQLLRKLLRAGVLESVRGEEGAEFRESEVYRLATRSPTKTVRSPPGGERRVLGDLANTPRKEEQREETREVKEVRRRRERSAGRKAREEEARRDLNLSYFQSLPSNSLIGRPAPAPRCFKIPPNQNLASPTGIILFQKFASKAVVCCFNRHFE